MRSPTTARLRSAPMGLVAAAALAVGAAPASAQLLAPTSPTDRSPYLDWPSLLPPLPGRVTAPTANDCAAGADCIDDTIAQMQQRLDALVPTCDDRAVFSLAYLRVTQDVRRAIHAGVFKDPAWVQNEDRVFAHMYFDAYDDYAAGRMDRVPRAWRITFDAERRRQVNAFGEFFLSMNAHINRDFPYVLAAIGLRRPDGASRKPDHDAYNRRLAALYEPVLHEVAARLDPTADDVDVGIIDNEQAFAVLQTWREGVWRNAERLVAARTPLQKRVVETSIEDYANSIAVILRETFAYRLAKPRAVRDAWCAVHGAQQPSASRRRVRT